MIDIIQYDFLYRYLDGSMTTTLDLYFNLKEFINNVKLNIITKDIGHMFGLLRSNNLMTLSTSINNRVEYDSEVVILPYTMILFTEVELKIKTKTLIIIGTLDGFEEPFNINRINSNWKYNDCYYLNNPPIHYDIEYYHKLSKYRLDRLTNLTFLTEDYDYCRKNKPHIFRNNVYFENIGKKIFEYCYHDKLVYYNSDGITINDGLYYYLKLFNIDGTRTYLTPLLITKNDVIDKMIMNKNDKIFDILEGEI